MENSKKKILLITTMYPDPLRPSMDICHYFAREWKGMGYDLLVINYRSMFPRIYTDLASLFPKLAYKYVGNHVEMDRNMNVIQHEVDGIPVYSIPIFKYIPHGPYSPKELDKQVQRLEGILHERDYTPDAIIGHFHNPQFQIIGALKKIYPAAQTCVSLHELSADPIRKCYGSKTQEVLHGVDMIGFRSVPIKKRFESAFGSDFKSVICWSGTPQTYLTTLSEQNRTFTDGPLSKFIYVGQTIKRKYPKETIEGIHIACGNNPYKLTYVGSRDTAFDETQGYIIKHKLSERVHFAGQIPREEIIRYYDQSECFIMISTGEVFGLVYLEAMSRGCITIASRDEGMEGIIVNGENGFLCEGGNAKELAEIIKYINSLSAEEKQKISDNARLTAERLSDYNVAKNYIEGVLNS